MKLIEHRALRGPNRYSLYPTILALVDIGELEDQPSDTIAGFPDRLVERLPSLYAHRCSLGTVGGFITRLHRGTWAGHIVEHVAIELQCLAGMEVGFGKTLGTPDRGIYKIAYRYRVESAGLAAGRAAIALVEATITGKAFDVATTVAHLRSLRAAGMLGPSTQSIVSEATRRGIPTIRLNDESFVQLGHGVKQRRIQATMTDRTSALSVEIADEKSRTKSILQRAGIPCAEGSLVHSFAEARSAGERLGYPVAVKPQSGNHGRGITARVSGAVELEKAFASAQRVCRSVLVEKTLEGRDYRVLVIDGKLAAAALREPAHVIGDGESSIAELIERTNADPRRGDGHEKMLTSIVVDEMTERLLVFRGLELTDVLPGGEKLYLKSTANLSTGGTAKDVTDEVHPDVRAMCERCARIIGMDCIGIDIVAPSLSQPLRGPTAGIVEVNAAPGFRMHLEPSEGSPRDVAKRFVDMLFAPDQDHQVPIVAITGTNGKTTTAKLVAHALGTRGSIVGFAGTTGVDVDGLSIASGDYSGPEGAGMVLREPTIDHAVLEVARGGIVRRGLGFSECHVGVLLNVASDHLGCDGVDDLGELALVKAAVLEAVRDEGVSVLNADDEIVVGLVDRARGRVIYFSLRDNNPVVRRHLQAGGMAVVINDMEVVVLSSEAPVHVLNVADAPVTLGGAAAFNTANVLAAVAALVGLGVPIEAIRKGITTFHPSATQNPGRLNLVDFGTFKVLLDYGHNVPAVRAIGELLPKLTRGRAIVVAHGTGNRRDEDIREFGAALAAVYDHLIVADVDPRRRAPGTTPALVREGAIATGLVPERVEVIDDPLAAVDRAFALVEPGDLIVVQVDEFEPMRAAVMKHQKRSGGVAAGREA